MAHKKTKNECNFPDSSKKSDKIQTFVKDFRNAVETRVKTMEDTLEQNVLKIDSHFNLRKAQTPQEVLQMKFLDYIESQEKKTSKATDDDGKKKTAKKKTKALTTNTAKKSKATTKGAAESAKEVKNVEVDPTSCNIIEILCKENIDLQALNIPPEMESKFLENIKKLEEQVIKK